MQHKVISEVLDQKIFKSISKRMTAGLFPGSRKVADKKYILDLSKSGSLYIKNNATGASVSLMPTEILNLADFILENRSYIEYWLKLSRENFEKEQEELEASPL